MCGREQDALTPAVYIAGAAVIGVLGAGGALTTIGAWYAALRKPVWQPPGWLFGPAWTLIGGLTAWAGVLAWQATRTPAQREVTLGLFALNGGLNILWSALFFKLQRPDWALIEVIPLWLSIAALIAAFAARVPLAAWLLAPYLLWVAFAAVLNLVVVRLNAPFPHRVAS